MEAAATFDHLVASREPARGRAPHVARREALPVRAGHDAVPQPRGRLSSDVPYADVGDRFGVSRTQLASGRKLLPRGCVTCDRCHGQLSHPKLDQPGTGRTT
jgi:hypothetical protein